MAAEAIRVATRLRHELGDGSLASAEQAALRPRPLRTLGGWLDEQRAESRAAIEMLRGAP